MLQKSGVAITNIQNGSNFAESMMNSLGTSVGFLISIVIMAGIRERIEGNNIPKPWAVAVSFILVPHLPFLRT